MLKKLLSRLREYKRAALLTPVFLVLEVAMEVFIPLIMAHIIDVALPTGDTNQIVRLGILMIGMAIFGVVFGVIATRFAAHAGTGFGTNLRGDLFAKVQQFSFANVDKFSTGSLLTRLTADVMNTQNAFVMVIRILGRSPVMMISALVMSLRINGRLTLAFGLAIPVLLLVFVVIAKNAFPRFAVMMGEFDHLNSAVQENLSGIRVVKSFVRQEYEEEKFNAVADRVRQALANAEYVLVFAMPSMQLVMFACLLVIYWLGGQMVISQELLVGQFFSLFSYVMQILISFIMLGGVFVQVMISRASMIRITEVLDEPISITDKPDGIEQVAEGSIEFSDVNFRYFGEDGEALVLDNLNLSIASGETVGIIGSTGSAKSTLVQLIPRLYDVTSGVVRVGGVDVRDYKLHPLREAVAMVLQQNVLFSGTIGENLRWGNPDATDEQLIAACKIASAHDFISSFPQGYDSWLEQGGVNLSGGQKQRLCIARALLKQPKIIIMDDSTSAVDTATDGNIRRALKETLGGTTTIIIAQRIASVMDADHIVVMEGGEIVALGTHEELLLTSELYREIYLSQQKEVA